MEKDKKETFKKGYINKYHLIYPLIIMSIIIILLTSFVFKSSDYAGSMLSFAATLSSVLLAVVAIIITLIDATGQRDNVYEVKNSVEELKEITEGFKELQNEYIENNKKIIEQIAALEEGHTVTNELLERVGDMVQKIETDDDQEELTQDLEEIKSMIKEQQNKRMPSISPSTTSLSSGVFGETSHRFTGTIENPYYSEKLKNAVITGSTGDKFRFKTDDDN